MKIGKFINLSFSKARVLKDNEVTSINSLSIKVKKSLTFRVDADGNLELKLTKDSAEKLGIELLALSGEL